jgi:Tol biopolymer transport system component
VAQSFALSRRGILILLLLGFGGLTARQAAADELADELKRLPFKIVYETHREGNWDLFMVNADGTHPVNVTRTPTINEMYPHVSPDGTKVSFVVDEEESGAKIRNVYITNIDGSGRRLVAKNAREPFWNPSGTAVVYAKGESEKFSLTDYYTKGIYSFDLASGTEKEHPNRQIHHLYNMCITPDGRWYISTVHAGMSYGHAILALEAEGDRVVNLKLPGCRPDISPDGKKVAWGADDFTLRVGDLDFSGPEPKVIHQRDAIRSPKPIETYHVDWSPDGKYLAFSRGPKRKHLGPAPEMVGAGADDWNICVADASATNRWVAITTDGKSNKEPDWVPAPKEKP